MSLHLPFLGSQDDPCQSDIDCMAKHFCDGGLCQAKHDVIQQPNIDYADTDYADSFNADSNSEADDSAESEKSNKNFAEKNLPTPLSLSVRQNPVDKNEDK